MKINIIMFTLKVNLVWAVVLFCLLIPIALLVLKVNKKIKSKVIDWIILFDIMLLIILMHQKDR